MTSKERRRHKQQAKRERSRQFAEAKGALAVMGAMASDGVPHKPVVLRGQGGRAFGLAVRVGPLHANVWRPSGGIEVVQLNTEEARQVRVAILQSETPFSGTSELELASVRRRAFLPRVVTQIYVSNPTLALLNTPTA